MRYKATAVPDALWYMVEYESQVGWNAGHPWQGRLH